MDVLRTKAQTDLGTGFHVIGGAELELPACGGEGDGALALPIPYHAGDIVEVDCLPFAPVRRVLILEKGNGSNTLCLYPTIEGKWTTGFFERGQIMDCYTPALSPLYRISLYSGYLPRNEQLLKSVQTYIGGSAENGKRLMDAFYECELSGMKEKKLLALIGKTKKPDMLMEAYSPLGTGAMLQNPVIGDLAEKYGKTAAQICLRWNLQKGFLPLPKSITDERIRSNTKIFDFSLDEDDMQRLAALDGVITYSDHPDLVDF